MSIQGIRWFSFQRKMLLTYVFVVSLPFTIAFAIFVIGTTHETKLNNINYLIQLNEQVSDNIDICIADVDRITFLNIVDRNIENILAKENKQTPIEFIEDLRFMQTVIAHSTKLNPFIQCVTFTGYNGNIYSNAGIDNEYNMWMQKWMLEAKAKNGKRFVSPVYNGSLSFTNMKLLTISRALFDSANAKQIGCVNIDIDFKRIQNLLDSQLQSDQINNLFIIQNNKIIYHSVSDGFALNETEERELINEISRKFDQSLGRAFNIEINKQEYLLVGCENKFTGWKLIQYISMKNLNRSIINSIRFYSTTMSVLLLLAILAGYVFSRNMVKPINKLHKAIKQVENGSFAIVEGQDKRKDDIGLLIKSFNRMVIRLKESINKEYTANVNQKKIEIKMLQAQINPHFLYNTLSLISSIAEIEGVPQISLITNKLSQMFRYNIKEQNVVRVFEEINQIRNYIYIQKLRFLDKIEDKISIEESLEDCFILKFLLQPIVENAVYHGVEKQQYHGIVAISVSTDKDDLIIEVKDNGVGMSQEQTEEINRKLVEQSDRFIIGNDQYNLGLRNVHYRIRNFYGEAYGLKINSSPGEGTCVKIRIPKTYDDFSDGGEQ